MGVGPARHLVEQLRTEAKVAGSRETGSVRALLRAQLIEAIGPDLDRSLAVSPHDGKPAVLLDRRGQRHRQDHHLRQARPGPHR